MIPFAKKILISIENQILWENRHSYQHGVIPIDSVNLVVIPIAVDDRIHLPNGTSIVIRQKALLQIETPHMGEVSCVLQNFSLSQLEQTKKWQGCYHEPGTFMQIPDYPGVLFSFDPDVVDFAILLCHNRSSFFLLVAQKLPTVN